MIHDSKWFGDQEISRMHRMVWCQSLRACFEGARRTTWPSCQGNCVFICQKMSGNPWKSHSIRIDFIYNPSTIHLPCYSIIPWYSMIFHDSFLSYPQSIVHLEMGNRSIEAWSWKPLSTWMYDRIRISRLLDEHNSFTCSTKFRLRHVRQRRRQQPRPHKQLLPESPVWEQRYVKTSTSNCGVDI